MKKKIYDNFTETDVIKASVIGTNLFPSVMQMTEDAFKDERDFDDKSKRFDHFVCLSTITCFIALLRGLTEDDDFVNAFLNAIIADIISEKKKEAKKEEKKDLTKEEIISKIEEILGKD